MTDNPSTEVEFNTPLTVLTEDPRLPDATPLECTVCGGPFKIYTEGPPALILVDRSTGFAKYDLVHNTVECLNGV